MGRHSLAAAPVALTLALVPLAAVAPPAFDALVSEDAVLEWVQFSAYAVAAGAFGLAAMGRGGTERVVLAAACAVAVAIAGEEIAWGQRLLDLRLSLQEVNTQGELTAHNMPGALRLSQAAFALLGLAGAVVRRVAAAVPGALGRALRLLAPPPAFVAWFALGAAYGALRLTVWTSPSYTTAKLSEVPETAVAVAIAVCAWRARRAVAAPSVAPAAAPGAAVAPEGAATP